MIAVVVICVVVIGGLMGGIIYGVNQVHIEIILVILVKGKSFMNFTVMFKS